jgi:hypothetical protein
VASDAAARHHRRVRLKARAADGERPVTREEFLAYIDGLIEVSGKQRRPVVSGNGNSRFRAMPAADPRDLWEVVDCASPEVSRIVASGLSDGDASTFAGELAWADRAMNALTAVALTAPSGEIDEIVSRFERWFAERRAARVPFPYLPAD